MNHEIFSIGHSNHPAEVFLGLLRLHSIDTVCDVRSRPYSRWNPQFNRETLDRSLRDSGIVYRFLGSELGARPEGAGFGPENCMSYDEMARIPRFQDGLEQVRELMTIARVALLCAERDPLFCHRAILVSRRLRSPNLRILHILADGGIETHEELELRMLAELGVKTEDLFEGAGEVIERAYGMWEEKMRVGK
ncbi:MAG: DUF488 domain-containing protein [Candidatus Latescibacterota bacterium]